MRLIGGAKAGGPLHGDDNPGTVSIVPTMTAANQPSGWLVTEDSVYFSNNGWKAFDPSDSFPRPYWASGNAAPNWLQVDLPESLPINKYYVRVSSSDYPQDWELKGSNTGAFTGEEVLLDSRSSVTFGASYAELVFTFENSSPYTSYRMTISVVSTSSRTAIDFMRLIQTQGT